MAIKSVKKPPVEVKISEVLEMLDNGKTRPEIAKHFDLNLVQVASLFRHEKLRGKKTKKIASDAYNIIDDAPDAPILNIPTGGKKTNGEDEASTNGTQVASEAASVEPQPVQQSW